MNEYSLVHSTNNDRDDTSDDDNQYVVHQSTTFSNYLISRDQVQSRNEMNDIYICVNIIVGFVSFLMVIFGFMSYTELLNCTDQNNYFHTYMLILLTVYIMFTLLLFLQSIVLLVDCCKRNVSAIYIMCSNVTYMIFGILALCSFGAIANAEQLVKCGYTSIVYIVAFDAIFLMIVVVIKFLSMNNN